MNLVDRLLTIIVTATITSAAWIVFGGSLMELASDKEGEESMRPSEAAPSPSPTETEASVEAGAGEGEPEAGMVAASLDSDEASSERRIDDGTLVVPVLNVRPSDLTDTFLDERGDETRLHEAIDIMAPKGTSVVAAAPGTIEKLFTSDAGGLTIYVRSPDRRTIHYYAHLDEYAPGLKEGQRVRRSQRLGTVGSTGNASPEAPHLHFAILRTTADAEWWEPANAVNPYPLLTRR